MTPPTSPNDPSVRAMWAAYLASIGEEPSSTSKTYTAWHFCDTAESATELAELVLAGTKRATAGAMTEYEADGDALPRAGDLSVVTDGAGEARCVIRTIRVDTVSFEDVDEEFARTEGEGDGSLEYWRRVHWEYFTRTLAPLGTEPNRDMELACERFEVVFPRPPSAGS